jgi:hypothetical protein
MNNRSAIKWRLVWINTWIIGALFFVCYIIEERNWGTHYTNWVFGTLFLVYAMIYYIRVRVYQILLVFGVLGLGFYHSAIVFDNHALLSGKTLFLHLAVWIVVFFTGMPVVVRAYKLEIHSRKIFKLAAERVGEKLEGFTSRPFTAGKYEFTREEVIGFARFLNAKDIARYRLMDDTTNIGLSMGISPLADPDFERISMVSFRSDGELFIHIAESDYTLFRDKLSFNQLCASLAELLIRFLEFYREGHDERIIRELKNI